jgi:glyoxylate reductase
LALANRIVEADEFIRQGKYKGWEPELFLGTNLIGKTLGIIGLGRIGTMVARRAKGWKMKIIYYKRTRDMACEREMGVLYCPLDEVFAKSDFLSLHVPLSDETRHMINKETLSKMKKGAYLINTARGGVVKEHDLIDALKSGQIGGAALDVFEDEKNISQELLALPNTITTPHIASATFDARNKMGEMAVNAIIYTFSNKKPINIVNEEVWQNRRK